MIDENYIVEDNLSILIDLGHEIIFYYPNNNLSIIFNETLLN